MKKWALLMSAASLLLFACEERSEKTETREDQQKTEREEGTRRVSLRDEDSDTESDEDSDSDTSDRDRALTDRIKQTLSNDSNISSAARRIIITTNNGAVTLKGKVNTEREKILIANKVRQLNGVNSINNQIEIASNSEASSSRSYY